MITMGLEERTSMIGNAGTTTNEIAIVFLIALGKFTFASTYSYYPPAKIVK